MGKVRQFLKHFSTQADFLLSYVIKFVGILGLIYGITLLCQLATGNRSLNLTIGDILLVCGALVFVAGFIAVIVTASIKSFRNEDSEISSIKNKTVREMPRIDIRIDSKDFIKMNQSQISQFLMVVKHSCTKYKKALREWGKSKDSNRVE